MADPEVTCTTDLEHTCHANALFDELVRDIPVFDSDTLTDLLDIKPIYDETSFAPLTPLTLDSLTTGEVGGTGAFDVLMESINNHLKNEYDNNRISGAEFTRAYIALTESAMANSVQFLLQKDKSYWDAVTAQIQASQAQILLAQAKVQTITSLAQLEYQKAQYAVTKLSLDKLNIEVGEILPLQVEKAAFEMNKILPKQDELIKAQVAKEWAATKNKGPSWTPGAAGQPDTVSPNTDDIEGVIGLQKNLYTQQEKSYKQDTINSTLQHLHSTWAAGITNGIPGIQIPDAVHKNNFSSKVINPQLAALAANSGWTYSAPDPITEP